MTGSATCEVGGVETSVRRHQTIFEPQLVKQIQTLPMTERDTLYDDASSLVAIGELDEAVALYRRSVDLDTQFSDGWHALGMARMKSGNVKEAIGAGLMATTISPKDL